VVWYWYANSLPIRHRSSQSSWLLLCAFGIHRHDADVMVVGVVNFAVANKGSCIISSGVRVWGMSCVCRGC
jgi:hypothetical protein